MLKSVRTILRETGCRWSARSDAHCSLSTTCGLIFNILGKENTSDPVMVYAPLHPSQSNFLPFVSLYWSPASGEEPRRSEETTVEAVHPN